MKNTSVPELHFVPLVVTVFAMKSRWCVKCRTLLWDYSRVRPHVDTYGWACLFRFERTIKWLPSFRICQASQIPLVLVITYSILCCKTAYLLPCREFHSFGVIYYSSIHCRNSICIRKTGNRNLWQLNDNRRKKKVLFKKIAPGLIFKKILGASWMLWEYVCIFFLHWKWMRRSI